MSFKIISILVFSSALVILLVILNEVLNLGAELEALKNIVQIIFWIFTGLYIYKTYRQAKKNLFSSSKSEVFKTQLKVLSDMAIYLNNYENYDFNLEENIDKAIKLNILAMLDEMRPSNISIENNKAINNMYKSIIDEGFVITIPAGNIVRTKRIDDDTTARNKGHRHFYAHKMSESEFKRKIDIMSGDIFIPDTIKEKLKAVSLKLESKIKIFHSILDQINIYEFSYENDGAPSFIRKVAFSHFGPEVTSRLYVDREINAVLKEIREYLKINELIE